MNRGATRLVLIRSGGYDYAEIELSNPVHLVAANNAGKTTLINALQFLYIDNFNDMHFPHDARATKEHYFPNEGSMVLFECLTPTGLQVLAFRGLGPVRGYEYERLIYAGEYERSDFVDGNLVRTWGEVKQRLIARGVRMPLSAGNIRATLTANGDTNGPALGLVPLARSENYVNFRFLFRNLVTLSRIDQEKLKSLFVDISRHRLSGNSRVDLRSDYAESYQRINEGMNTIARLRRIEQTARRLSDQYQRREESRATLVSTWKALTDAFVQHQANDHREQREIARQRQELELGLSELDQELAGLTEQSESLNIERGRRMGLVEELEALRERAKGVVPNLEMATRDRLIGERDALIKRIGDVTTATADDVAGQIAAVEPAIERNAKLLERHADAIATWLRAHSGLPPAALDQVFRILHPHLLTGLVGDRTGDVAIEDAERLIAAVQQVHEHFTLEGFVGAGVRVPHSALSGDAPLTVSTDVDALAHDLKKDRARLSRLQQLQCDVEARQQLERQRIDLDELLADSVSRLRDWREWEASEAKLLAHTERLAAIGTELAEVAHHEATVREKQVGLRLGQQDLDQRAAAARKAYAQAVAAMRELSAPPPEWPEGAPAPSEPHDLAVVLDVYGQSWSKQVDAARKVEEHLATIESEGGARYFGATVSETLATLHGELEALPERVEGVKSQWTSLVTNMRSAFKGLVAGVDEIQRQVSTLNRRLGKRRISNLAQVELVLTTQEGLLKQLREVFADDAPLFAEDERRSKATQEVAGWLESRPVIELLELFDLRFRVIDRQGRERTFSSLNQIESQGTSTTIKVLVHLELMRSLLSDDRVSIPFVLDEVAALDDANLRNLIAHATAMGFVPVVASPQASDAVDTIYFLPQGVGRSTLTQANRVLIERAVHATA